MKMRGLFCALVPSIFFVFSSIFICTEAFGVEHPDGNFATPDDGYSFHISFKHINNTNLNDYPYGFFSLNSDQCFVAPNSGCETNCSGIIQEGAATLTTIPTSDIAVSLLVFNTVGIGLVDTTSKFCAVLDGAGNVWAIDRDLPAVSRITTANSTSRIIPCIDSDIFNPMTGCRQPSVFSIEGYIKLDTTGGNAPLPANCSQAEHDGRMVFDNLNDRLYICTSTGWIFK